MPGFIFIVSPFSTIRGCYIMLKSLSRLTALIPLLFLCNACQDEITDQAEIPSMYLQVEELNEYVNSQFNCDTMYDAIEKFSDEKRKPWDDACNDYNANKSKANADILAKRLTNSGYYMAMYILIDRLQKHISTCQSGKKNASDTLELYNDLFESDCSALKADASEIVKKYATPLLN